MQALICFFLCVFFNCYFLQPQQIQNSDNETKQERQIRDASNYFVSGISWFEPSIVSGGLSLLFVLLLVSFIIRTVGDRNKNQLYNQTAALKVSTTSL